MLNPKNEGGIGRWFSFRVMFIIRPRPSFSGCFFGIPNEVLSWFKQKISGLWLHGCFFWNPNTWIFQKFVAFHPKNRPKGRNVTCLEDPGISICISLSRITLKMNKAGFWSLFVWRIIPIWETSQTLRRIWNCSTSLGDVCNFFLGVSSMAHLWANHYISTGSSRMIFPFAIHHHV